MKKELTIESIILQNSCQKIELGYSNSSNNIKQEYLIINTINNKSLLSNTLQNTLEKSLYTLKNIAVDNDSVIIYSNNISGKNIEQQLQYDIHSYDDLIYFAYEILKVAASYENIPNNILYNMFCFDQVVFIDNTAYFKEFIILDDGIEHSFADVVSQLGNIIKHFLDTDDEDVQLYLDNLRCGKHKYKDLNDLKSTFKDVFVYNKYPLSEITESIFNITFIDKNAPAPSSIISNETFDDNTAVDNNNDIDDIESSKTVLKENDDDNNEFHIHRETIVKSNIEAPQIDMEEANTIFNTSVEESHLSTDDNELTSSAIDNELHAPVYDKGVASPSNHDEIHSNLNENTVLDEDIRPTSSRVKRNRVDDDDDDLDFNIDPFEAFDYTDDKQMNKIDMKFAIIVTSIIVIVLGIFIFTFFRPPSDPVASFNITYADDRVVFENTSTSSVGIEEYMWIVKYDDVLLQTFDTSNFYPIFDTEGEYEITLRVKDSDDKWSADFVQIYDYNNSTDL